MTDASFPDTGFPASILVHTPSGAVPIAEIRVGDLVRSTDVSTGEASDRPVLETHVIDAARLWSFRWGYLVEGGESQEGVAVAGAAQRYWVTDGTEPGWTALSDLFHGDQWIAAVAAARVVGYGTEAGFGATDLERVAWMPNYRKADEGVEVEFDATGAITAFRGGVMETDTMAEQRPFRSPTRHLTVDGAHSFHVLDAGLLTADFTQYE